MKVTDFTRRARCAAITRMGATAGVWRSAGTDNRRNGFALPIRPTSMQKDSSAWSLSRRSALTLAGACLLPWKNLYASDFWNKKDPAQWTGDEIDQLTTKSPWAKQVTAQYAPGSNNGGYGQQGGGYPRISGGMGGPGRGDRRNRHRDAAAPWRNGRRPARRRLSAELEL